MQQGIHLLQWTSLFLDTLLDTYIYLCDSKCLYMIKNQRLYTFLCNTKYLSDIMSSLLLSWLHTKTISSFYRRKTIVNKHSLSIKHWKRSCAKEGGFCRWFFEKFFEYKKIAIWGQYRVLVFALLLTLLIPLPLLLATKK